MKPDDFEFVVAELAAHALNHLDGWPEHEDELGCCYRCCAPCHALHALYTAHELDGVVRPFIVRGDQWIWWREDHVDVDWLRRGWRDTQFHPVHGTINGQRPLLDGPVHPEGR